MLTNGNDRQRGRYSILLMHRRWPSRPARQKMKVPCNASHSADKTTTDLGTLGSGENKVSNAKRQYFRISTLHPFFENIQAQRGSVNRAAWKWLTATEEAKWFGLLIYSIYWQENNATVCQRITAEDYTDIKTAWKIPSWLDVGTSHSVCEARFDSSLHFSLLFWSVLMLGPRADVLGLCGSRWHRCRRWCLSSDYFGLCSTSWILSVHRFSCL